MKLKKINLNEQIKISGYEPKDKSIKLEDIYVDVYYDRKQKLYAICLKDKTNGNILSDYEYASDKEEAKFTKQMMEDDIRNWLDNDYTLIENVEKKTFKFPSDIVKNAMATYWSDRTCKLMELPIDKLVQDNNLLDDEDLQSYHKKQWDNKNASEFLINQDLVDKMRTSEVPYVVKKKDGRLELGDGRHRVRALYNSGYDYVELPTIIEELCESYRVEEDLNEAFYQVDDRFKKLINDCVDTLVKNGFNVPIRRASGPNLKFKLSDNISKLGSAWYPKHEHNGNYLITISNYLKDMDDEQIKNTIYHELGHILAYEDDFAKGYIYLDADGDTRLSGNNGKEWRANKRKLSHHGKVWQDIMQQISKITGQSYQRLANAEDTEDFSKATQDKYIYHFECPNCHSKLDYARKNEFVKTYDKVHSDGSPYWWCTPCKKSTGKKIAFVKLEGSK